MLSPKEFVHLGSRSAIGRALTRLTKASELLRFCRGTYVRPVTSRFGIRPPARDKVVQAIAVQRGEIVVPQGASSANLMGLTSQMPIRDIYLTSGRTRSIRLGRSTVLVKHALRGLGVLSPCCSSNFSATRLYALRLYP